MAHKREIEEIELKFSENVPVCNVTIPAEASDPKACDCRNFCGDPIGGGGKKRRREAVRCSGSGCRKRIGLIGFRCRCGGVFCSEHRYSDRHDCSFDYKAAGREAIARENPVVRAAKLVKV